MPICSEDLAAKKAAAELGSQLGFGVVDRAFARGSLVGALAMLWIHLEYKQDIGSTPSGYSDDERWGNIV